MVHVCTGICIIKLLHHPDSGIQLEDVTGYG